jgi:hypothetical protein
VKDRFSVSASLIDGQHAMNAQRDTRGSQGEKEGLMEIGDRRRPKELQRATEVHWKRFKSQTGWEVACREA